MLEKSDGLGKRTPAFHLECTPSRLSTRPRFRLKPFSMSIISGMDLTGLIWFARHSSYIRTLHPSRHRQQILHSSSPGPGCCSGTSITQPSTLVFVLVAECQSVNRLDEWQGRQNSAPARVILNPAHRLLSGLKSQRSPPLPLGHYLGRRRDSPARYNPSKPILSRE